MRRRKYRCSCIDEIGKYEKGRVTNSLKRFCQKIQLQFPERELESQLELKTLCHHTTHLLKGGICQSQDGLFPKISKASHFRVTKQSLRSPQKTVKWHIFSNLWCSSWLYLLTKQDFIFRGKFLAQKLTKLLNNLSKDKNWSFFETFQHLKHLFYSTKLYL